MKHHLLTFLALLLAYSLSGPAEIVAIDNGDINSGEMSDASTRSLDRLGPLIPCS